MKKTRRLVKKLLIFIGLLILGRLADYLPDVWWGLIIQIVVYGSALFEQFSFYRVPRLLIKDERFKQLSSDAKLLYGLMLDRMSMSMKNKWIDEMNRAYIIYTIDSIKEDLGCSKEVH